VTHSRISAVSVFATLVVLIAVGSFPLFAQQTGSVSAVVPTLVNFSGVLGGTNGKPLTDITGVTFSLYAEQEGGSPLWLETQNVQPNPAGQYSVMLGSTSSQGLPSSLFVSGQARWLEVQAQGQEPQPRIMLLSVPYAMKAGDAQTVGGLPPSAFVLAAPATANAASAMGGSKTASVIPAKSSDVTTTGGTANKIPMFTTATNIQNSILSQTGTTAINVGGNLNLPATGRFEIGSNLFAFGSYANQNAFLGFAGNTTTTGADNVASGYEALLSNTTGYTNTASGAYALYANTTGYTNTAVGNDALFSNTTGCCNDALGGGALFSNTTGSPNDAFGYGALLSNTTGANNAAFGFNALYSNTANDNTAVGVYALTSNTTGFGNDAFGFNALYSNTTGGPNAAFGYQALCSTTTGSGNDASGFQALYSNTTGYNNDALGYDALYSNTTGYDNDAFGFLALEYNTTGFGNDAFGYQALASNSTGCCNAAFGYDALYFNTTGYENTAVGYDELDSNTTGSDLTCIGFFCTASEDGLKNATAIGAHAAVGQSNSLVLGGTGQYAVRVGIGTTTPSNILTIGRGTGHPVSDSWETYSSRRWKTNIHPLANALSKVEQLRGVSYDLKDSGKHEIGVIAEEVGRVVPEVVTYEDNGKDARGVDYSRLTALLIEATKEQQALIHKQQEQIARLTAQVRTIRASLKTDSGTGADVRTVKVQATVQQ